MMFRRLPARIAAVAALVTSLPVGGCAPAKVDASVADVAPTDSPLGSVRQLTMTAVPLPPGEWVELTRAGGTLAGQDRISIGYGLIEKGILSVYLFVNTNTAARPGAQTRLSVRCITLAPRDEPTTFLQQVSNAIVNRQTCLRVTYVRLDPAAGGFDSQALNAARRYGGFAQDALNVFIEADYNGNVLIYSMYYFPERDGLSPGPWATGDQDPTRRSYLRSLVGWAQGFQHWVIDGAKNAL